MEQTQPTYRKVLMAPCPGDKANIWRYMDLAGLLQLFETRTLFFCPADRLGDPYEGALTIWQRMARSQKDGLPMIESLQHSDPNMQYLRQHYLVSCWHLSKSESQAMWQLYSHLHKGVAIESTVGRLKRSINGFGETIYIGSLDYSGIAANHETMLERLFLKRKAFAYEREFRAVIADKTLSHTDGLALNVEPGQLILSIHVSPFCATWTRRLVEQVTRRYGYKFKIKGGFERPIF